MDTFRMFNKKNEDFKNIYSRLNWQYYNINMTHGKLKIDIIVDVADYFLNVDYHLFASPI